MSNKSLTLSIVIPAYNEEHQLKNCLRAIAEQTTMPDEVIVVDNNSTDTTATIAQQFPFVNLIAESQQGIVFARNTGFNAARGDLIARIDADTVIPSDWVATIHGLANTMTPKDAGTGPCSFRSSIFPRVAAGFHRVIYFWSSRVLFGHHTLFGSNMFLFRSEWENVRDQVCLTTAVHEDMDLSAHIAADRGHIYFYSNLRASVSNRRFHNWGKYPGMWCYSWLIHLPPLRFFKTR